jgi:two-component system response regulator ChvI
VPVIKSAPDGAPHVPKGAPDGAPHVIVVDDDALFLRTFAANIETAGYRVTTFKRPPEALAAMLNEQPPAACILDWHMPEMDGLDLLRRLKASQFSAPIMFLTGLNQPMFEETAFDQGAIEFVEKTRSLAVILKRLERMISESQDQAARGVETQVKVALGPLTLDHRAKRALWNGEQVGLSLGEFEVTALMAAKAGTDISYREIYDVIQDTGFLGGRGPEGYRANVRAAIKRIRKKFIAIDPTFDALENYPGFGYRWKAHG